MTLSDFPVAAPPSRAGLAPRPDAGADPDRKALRESARAFEAGFLAEMLRAAGLGRTPQAFGGGAGEDGFASLLVDEQARLMVESGGIGLAEQVFRALLARESGR